MARKSITFAGSFKNRIFLGEHRKPIVYSIVKNITHEYSIIRSIKRIVPESSLDCVKSSTTKVIKNKMTMDNERTYQTCNKGTVSIYDL